MHKKQAFSLIELSVVLIVIGILAAGVLQGASLIKSARLTTARTLTSSSPVPSIEGLVAWYETSSADSLKESEAYNSGQISTWYDVSPASVISRKNTLTRTASSALTYKADGINGVPSLNFNGSGNIVLADFYQGATAQSTIIYVVQHSTISSIILDSGASGYGASAVGTDSSNNAHINLGTSSVTGSTNPANIYANKNYIIADYIASPAKVYVNNAATMAGAATISAGSGFLRGLTVGSDRASNYKFTGLISEIIIYSRPLQLQERKDVFKYLSTKYKIAVAGL